MAYEQPNDNLPNGPIDNGSPPEDGTLESREVVDSEGNVIGSLSVPPGLNDESWEYLLSHYSESTASPSVNTIISGKIKSAELFGKELIREIATDNVLAGATIDEIRQMISDHNNIILMLLSGSLYTAISAIQEITPTEILTQQRIDQYIGKIKYYLGEQ